MNCDDEGYYALFTVNYLFSKIAKYKYLYTLIIYSKINYENVFIFR